jgi:hypothetical protein
MSVRRADRYAGLERRAPRDHRAFKDNCNALFAAAVQLVASSQGGQRPPAKKPFAAAVAYLDGRLARTTRALLASGVPQECLLAVSEDARALRAVASLAPGASRHLGPLRAAQPARRAAALYYDGCRAQVSKALADLGPWLDDPDRLTPRCVLQVTLGSTRRAEGPWALQLACLRRALAGRGFALAPGDDEADSAPFVRTRGAVLTALFVRGMDPGEVVPLAALATAAPAATSSSPRARSPSLPAREPRRLLVTPSRRRRLEASVDAVAAALPRRVKICARRDRRVARWEALRRALWAVRPLAARASLLRRLAERRPWLRAQLKRWVDRPARRRAPGSQRQACAEARRLAVEGRCLLAALSSVAPSTAAPQRVLLVDLRPEAAGAERSQQAARYLRAEALRRGRVVDVATAAAPGGGAAAVLVLRLGKAAGGAQEVVAAAKRWVRRCRLVLVEFAPPAAGRPGLLASLELRRALCEACGLRGVALPEAEALDAGRSGLSWELLQRV